MSAPGRRMGSASRGLEDERMKVMRAVKVGLGFAVAVMAAGIVQGASVPGLYESRYSGRQVNDNKYSASTKDRITLAPYAARAYNNNVVLDPNDSSVTNWPSPKGGWADNTTFYYTGYIKIPADYTTVTFGACFDDARRLCIDDAELFRNLTWNAVAIGTRMLTPGWHKFDVWFDNGSSGYGPPDGAWGTGRGIGFGIDWAGRNSTAAANFVFPVDPGDGSLFRTELPPGAALIPNVGVPQGGTSATVLPVAIVAGENTEGTLRVYYGSAVPEAGDAWLFVVEYPETITASGTYDVVLTGLELGQRCYYQCVFSAEGEEASTVVTSFVNSVPVTSLTAQNVRGTSALLPASVRLAATDLAEAVLRVYYGATDKGASDTGWLGHVDYAGELTAGEAQYGVPVEGLTLGQKYFYRHAVVLGGVASYAGASLSFTTGDESLPTKFEWVGTAGTVDWHDPAAWKNTSGLDRPVPGVAKDQLVFNTGNGRTRTHTITNDVSFGYLVCGLGKDYDIRFAPGNDLTEAVTLTVDNGGAATEAHWHMAGEHRDIQVGSSSTALRDMLVLNLASPWKVTGEKYYAHYALVYSRITGGAVPGKPAITLVNPSNDDIYYPLDVMFTHPDNSFTGDIIVGAAGKDPFTVNKGNGQFAVRLCLGGRIHNDNLLSPYIEALGHSDNRVILGNARCRLLLQEPPANQPLNRTVMGIGQIRSVNMNGWAQEGSDLRRELRLGERAVLAPGVDVSARGTLELFCSNLFMDAGTRMQIKLNAADNDLVKVNASGTVNVAGGVEFVMNKEAHPLPGQTWAFLTINRPQSAVTGTLVSKTPNVQIISREVSGSVQFEALYAPLTLLVY